MRVTGYWAKHHHEWTPWYPERDGKAWGEARRCVKCSLRQWRVVTQDPPPKRAA